jgi:uncharacterized protein (DUF488 family)
MNCEKKVPIYTVGYGTRNIDDFVALLRRYNIKYLIDVRSKPYSSFKPEFSQKSIVNFLTMNNIKYIFMGDKLGGQPVDPSCFENGKVDYAKCQEKSYFKEGIVRLRKAWEKQSYVVLMCSEGKPQECHRSKLIGEVLVKENIDVAHIDECGEVKSQEVVISLLHQGQQSFEGFISFSSRKKYGNTSTK